MLFRKFCVPPIKSCCFTKNFLSSQSCAVVRTNDARIQNIFSTFQNIVCLSIILCVCLAYFVPTKKNVFSKIIERVFRKFCASLKEFLARLKILCRWRENFVYVPWNYARNQYVFCTSQKYAWLKNSMDVKKHLCACQKIVLMSR
jgi:hypothetical protein